MLLFSTMSKKSCVREVSQEQPGKRRIVHIGALVHFLLEGMLENKPRRCEEKRVPLRQ